MTIVASGELAIQDAGTNPSTGTLASLTQTIGNFNTDGYQCTRQTVSEGGSTFFIFAQQKIFDGVWYGFRSSGTGFITMEDNVEASDLGAGGFSNDSFDNPINVSIRNLSYEGGSSSTVLVGKIGWDHSVADSSTVGSLSSTTFSDNSGDTQTITDLLWLQNTASNTGDSGNLLVFSLANGTISSNSDNVFINISVNGQTFTRSSAFFLLHNGNAVWYWVPTDSQLNSMGTSGNITTTINGTTQSFNNGIAEEFGGADSSDVRMSHYYRNLSSGGGNILHNTVGIPESGEIKVSDFLGKAFTPQGITVNITGGSATQGKAATKNGFDVNNPSCGSINTSQPMSAFGATGTFNTITYASNSFLFAIRFAISSGSVGTTSWTSMKLSKSGSSDITLNRSALAFNGVVGSEYFIQWNSSSTGNTTTAQRNALISMMSSGNITVFIS